MARKEIKPFASMEEAKQTVNNILNPSNEDSQMDNLMSEVHSILSNAKTEVAPERTPMLDPAFDNSTVFDKEVAEAPFFGMGFHTVPENVSMSVEEALAHCVDDKGNKGDDIMGKKHLTGIPAEAYEKLIAGEKVTIELDPTDLVTSHMATYNTRTNNIAGVVSPTYGLIQNTTALAPLNMMLKCQLHGENPRLVSAGMVRNGMPYLQFALPKNALSSRIMGDNSDTQAYLTFFNSFDGSSACGYKISFIRVVCRNTFMMNAQSKYGIKVYHKAKANESLDLTKMGNVEKMMEWLKGLDTFQDEYFESMNRYAKEQVDEAFINRICANIFLNLEDKSILSLAQSYDYDIMKMPIAEAKKENGTKILDANGKPIKSEGISTRAKNQYIHFRNTLESGVGQDALRGSKAWLFNGFTNYYNNEVSYGGANDDKLTVARKRFDALSGGVANKNMLKAYEFLAV